MSSRTIRVHVDLGGETIPAGTATFHEGRTRTHTTFTYDPEYVARRDSYQIDPQLPLDSSPGTITGLPGAFSDASPDRWGQNLIRREAIRLGRRKAPTEVDYLLEASDVSRQGALRFCTSDGEPYLEDHGDVPKTLELSRLMEAAKHAQDDEDYPVGELLDAGSGTLGGARPKASVTDDEGRLMIAKFPATSDEWDVIRWEQTALELSRRSGIETPESQLMVIADQPVVLIARFDRDGAGRRGYLSAHTLIGGDRAYGADYLDIADELEAHSDDYNGDAEELFRRASFSVGIHNTDDHTRNHGILRSDVGWRLSPVFDVNPNPDPTSSRSTSIVGATRSVDEAEGLTRLAEEIGITDHRAAEIISEVRAGISGWEQIARAHGLGDTEIRRFATMFAQQDEVLLRASGDDDSGGRGSGTTPPPGPAGDQPRDRLGRYDTYEAAHSAVRLRPNRR